MKKIKLACGKFTLVDDEFEYLFEKYTWRSYFDGWNWYVRRHTTINKKSITILLHREILCVNDKKVIVDHKDGDGLNNQKNNLRECSHSENRKNRHNKNDKNTSMYLGVSLKTTKYKYKTKNGDERVSISKRWEARIQHSKKQICIGLFDSEIDAALAYNKKAIEFHKEFANLNIIK